MMSCLYRSCILLACLAFFWSCEPEPPAINFSELPLKEQRNVENALASFSVADDLSLSLFASEPMVVNPTNMAIDEKGRVWVCEATNYRLFRNKQYDKKEAGDRILILEDTDQDGVADKKTVFYQGPEIDAAIGIAVLGNQVIVSVSPNVFVFTDEDGDDVADTKEVLFTGMGGVDHDHGVHAFVFGPDGKLYFNFGNEGKQLLDKDGNPVVDQFGQPIKTNGEPYRQGVAFRCDLDGKNVEVLGHNFRNPFELCVDPYGNIWQSDNDDDGNQGTRILYMMEHGNYGFRDAITGANWRAYRTNWEEEVPQRHWHQNDPGVVPNMLFTGAGSPTGICWYQGDLLPEVFQNQPLHCEPLRNVVRAYPVTSNGAGFEAEIVNLLKSVDPWFRPSDVAIAPDGSVFISDWYDAGVGGHKMDDIQRGRIYRISKTPQTYSVPEVSVETPESAVKALLSANQAINYLGWQALKNMGLDAQGVIEEVWNEANDLDRAKAWWLLIQNPSIAPSYIEEAMMDENPQIRVMAIRGARSIGYDGLRPVLKELSTDKHSAVRREVAIALRGEKDPEASLLWSDLAKRYDGKDRWYLEALGLGADLFPNERLDAFLTGDTLDFEDVGIRDIIWRVHGKQSITLLEQLITTGNLSQDELPRFFRAFHFKNFPEKNTVLGGLFNANLPHQDLINQLAVSQMDWSEVDPTSELAEQVKSILPSIAGSIEWIQVIKALDLKSYTGDVLALFQHSEESMIRNQAGNLVLDLEGQKAISDAFDGMEIKEQQQFVEALGNTGHPEALKLLKNWLLKESVAYPVKAKIVPAIGRIGNGEQTLLAMLKDGQLEGNLKNTAALRLLNSWNTEISGPAKYFLDRAKSKTGGSLASIDELSTMDGYAESGAKVFNTYCSSCHQINGEGTEFGPDLSKIGDKLAKEAMYSSIIYPSAGINFGYEGFRVHVDGDIFYSGYIVNETENELTLKVIGGVEQVILKDQIIEMEAIDQSLMTANLHQIMEQQELVNLVTYLTTLK